MEIGQCFFVANYLSRRYASSRGRAPVRVRTLICLRCWMVSLRRSAEPPLPPAIRRAGDEQKHQDADNRELYDHSQSAPCGKEK